MVHRHDGPFFTGSVLRVSVERRVAFIVFLFAKAVLTCLQLTGVVGVQHLSFQLESEEHHDN